MSENFPAFPKQGASVEEVNDIGSVAKGDVDTYDSTVGSEVAGVLQFYDFVVCLNCKSNIQAIDVATWL